MDEPTKATIWLTWSHNAIYKRDDGKDGSSNDDHELLTLAEDEIKKCISSSVISEWYNGKAYPELIGSKVPGDLIHRLIGEAIADLNGANSKDAAIDAQFQASEKGADGEVLATRIYAYINGERVCVNKIALFKKTKKEGWKRWSIESELLGVGVEFWLVFGWKG